MKAINVSTTVRLASALAMLSVSLLLISSMLGLLPNRAQLEIESRLQLSELLAVAITLHISDGNNDSANRLISMLEERNEEIQSIALHQYSAQGKELGEIAAAQTPEGDTAPTESTSTFFVPINQGGEKWGSLELVFREQAGLGGILKGGSLYTILLFIGVTGFLTYWLFLKRALSELDPSAVVPDQINAVLDTLSEGIVMLDRSGRVVLSNQSFRLKTDRLATEIIGRKLSMFEWTLNGRTTNWDTLPWDALLNNGERNLSSEIELRMPGRKPQNFDVRIASIQSPDGQVRGAVVTFDDITETMLKNANLERALEHLEVSKREIQRQNKELIVLATHDPLTNVLNRRSFFEGMRTLFEDPTEIETPISCIMLDLDHFKSINDDFGHAAGDKVITMLADVLKVSVPKKALVGRYGGEEFCVVLPDLSESKAVIVAESIRLQVCEKSRELADIGDRQITVSLGVSCDIGRRTTIDALIDLADKALYAAKDSGRNKVICCSQLDLSVDNPVEGGMPTKTVPSSPLTSLERDSGMDARDDELEKSTTPEIVALTEIDESEDALPSSHDVNISKPAHDVSSLISLVLSDRIAQFIAHASSSDTTLAIVIIDFPTVSLIRTAAGDGTAQKLLTLGIEKINSSLRDADSVAGNGLDFPLSRLGANQCITALPDINGPSLVPQVVQRLFSSLDTPINLEGREVLLDARVGVSYYPLDGTDGSELVVAADAALQEALHYRERNTCAYFNNSMNAHSERFLYMQSQLHHALNRGELFLMYQPLVDMRTGKISSLEALIRWRHPQLGLISPEQFIPIAEQTRLIDDIGDWVIETACLQLKEWNNRGFNELNIAVNIAAPQLRRKDLVSRIDEVIRSTEIDPATLTIELTETTLIESFDVAVSVVNELSKIGTRIALDDFGTGYSSLSYLKSFPIDVVKIDRSFFTEFPDDAYSMSIVSAIISMVHSLDLKVVAEGVETSDQLAFLQSLNIDVVQGYYFSAPLTHQQLISLLDNPEQIRRKFHIASTLADGKTFKDTWGIDGVINKAPPWAA